VYGLDLSLSQTGIAGVQSGRLWTASLSCPPARNGVQRLDEICRSIRTFINHTPVDLPGASNGQTLVVVEGPIYHAPKIGIRGFHERAGLWWLVARDLWARGIPFAVAPPSTVKKFATGKGNAGKDQVFAAMLRKFPAIVQTNDEADAGAAALMGAARLGLPLPPELEMNGYRLEALSGVSWPDNPEATGYAGPFTAQIFPPMTAALGTYVALS
jgi:hypothetical protein